MTQIENYKIILQEIFEIEIIFTNPDIENNCIGALFKDEESIPFRSNFIERLKRLREHFKDNENILIEIIKKKKKIGQTTGYKWAGPYSELVALDYWIQFPDLLHIKFPDKGDVNTFADSIAKQIGQKEVDLDISLELSSKKIYTDVKCLIPTHMELVDQIIDKVKSKTKKKDYLIGIDNLFDVDYLRTKSDFITEFKAGTLINKLAESIDKSERLYTHTLLSGEQATFRISHSKTGIGTLLSTMREIDVYKLASDYKYKILDYYNKLLINEPSLITLVINPWFNPELNIPNKEFISTFLRSLSRRVFIELTKDNTDMETIFPDLIGKNIKISDIAKKITGIIFIKDNSIMESGTDLYDTYIYLNPNATNKKLRGSDFSILEWTPEIKQPYIDDFYYDNY